MKVCQVSTVSPTFDTRVFQRECRSLAAAGHQVVLIAQHDREEVVDGVRVLPLPKVRNRLARIIGYPWRAYKLAMAQKPDLVHLHDPELLFVGVLMRLRGKKVVYGVREDHPRCVFIKDYIPKPAQYVVSVALKVAEQTCSRTFNAIVAVTEDIRGNFGWHKRALLVRNFPVLSPRTPCREPLDGRPTRFLYIGGINKIRGVEAMVQAIGLLPESAHVELLLAGGWAADGSRERCQAMPGWARTRELGYVDMFEHPEVFDQADVGLCVLEPSRHHLTSLPLKLFDYMQNAMPLIASNFPEWIPIVEGHGAGLCVDALDPQAIADAMVRLMDDPLLRAEMGARGRQAVLEEYNWEPEFRRMEALYRQLLS